MNRASEGIVHAPRWHNRFALYHVQMRGQAPADPIIRSFWSPPWPERLVRAIARLMRPRAYDISRCVALGFSGAAYHRDYAYAIRWYWRAPSPPVTIHGWPWTPEVDA